MKPIERQHIEYLKREKDTLVDNFIGACEEINRQIKDVKSGEWLRQVQEGNAKIQCREC